MLRSAWRDSASRRSRRGAERASAAAGSVLRHIGVEVTLVGLEMGRANPVREVEEVAGLRRVDARLERGSAGVADRARWQAGVLARVVRVVHRELGTSRFGGQAAEPIEE